MIICIYSLLNIAVNSSDYIASVVTWGGSVSVTYTCIGCEHTHMEMCTTLADKIRLIYKSDDK